VLLILMMLLRDAGGMAKAISELCEVQDAGQIRNIRAHIDSLIDTLPLTRLPGPMEAMRLLEKIALDGVRFPASLLMFRKAAFTLEGVVEDVAGTQVQLDALVASHTLGSWKDSIIGLLSLLSPGDWVALDWSALTLASRVSIRALFRPWYWLPGVEANPGIP
jgi:ubiquinone biosynthesis protein